MEYYNDCLTHDPLLRDGFDYALKCLKGQVIPKNLVKRTPYHVCTCKKKKTILDDTNVDRIRLLKQLKTIAQNKLFNESVKSSEDGDVHCESTTSDKSEEIQRDTAGTEETEVVCLSGHSDVEIRPPCDNDHLQFDTVIDSEDGRGWTDVVGGTRLVNAVYHDVIGYEDPNRYVSDSCSEHSVCECSDDDCVCADDVKEDAPEDADDAMMETVDDIQFCTSTLFDNCDLLLELLSSCDKASHLSLSKRRLLAVIYRCLIQETELLEPRALQKEKADELRKLCRNFYFKNYKKLTAKKYPVRETILLNEPTMTIATFVGKQGKNIDKINEGKDCQLSVKKGVSPDHIEITIRAKTSEDFSLLRGRVHLVKTYIKEQQRDWERKQKEERAIRHTREKRGKVENRQFGTSQWDIEFERKESARDEFSKKVSYHNHSLTRVNQPHRGMRCVAMRQRVVNHVPRVDKPSKTTVLDEGSRCLNCLVAYDKSLMDTKCRYHPGYIVLDTWNCCTRVVRGRHKGRATDDHRVDAQRDSHQYNGCTFGRHNWRLTKDNIRCVKARLGGTKHKVK